MTPFRALAVALAALISAPLSAQTTQCGVERWPVKILADSDSGRVDLVARDTTIAGLIAIPRPAGPFPQRARVAPDELTTWRVRAILWEVRIEPDGDLHLVLASPDDTQVRMIAEVPNPDCALTSRHAPVYAQVRSDLRRLGRRALVWVTGVAFFDRPHGQRGAAANNIELHPVLKIEPAP